MELLGEVNELSLSPDPYFPISYFYYFYFLYFLSPDPYFPIFFPRRRKLVMKYLVFIFIGVSLLGCNSTKHIQIKLNKATIVDRNKVAESYHLYEAIHNVPYFNNNQGCLASLNNIDKFLSIDFSSKEKVFYNFIQGKGGEPTYIFIEGEEGLLPIENKMCPLFKYNKNNYNFYSYFYPLKSYDIKDKVIFYIEKPGSFSEKRVLSNRLEINIDNKGK